MENGKLPYTGVRVVDFSRLLPGGWCTQFLADCGADVIKVEHAREGDYSRHNPPNFKHTGVYFNSVNRNKRSLALDLACPASGAVVRRLLETADVVVESFRPGVPARLELDYANARARNAGVVYCSITGFGQDGPLAGQAGHDLNVQGMTGLMSLGLEPGELPRLPGFQAGDYAGATMACMGIMAGLAARAQTGQGCYLDISMFDALMSMCNIATTGAFSRLAGGTGRPAMEPWGANPRYAVYFAGDGLPVSVSLLERKFWKLFCEEIGRPELYNEGEESHERHTDHGEHRPLYRQAIVDFCRRHPRAELVRRMQAAGIPLFPVYTPDEAVQAPVVQARGMVEFIVHPLDGRIPQLGNPITRGGLANTQRAPAPALGAHTHEVLAELGFSPPERAELERQGAIPS
jgi:crotonobetainyl-CoA:carnitine CoA-transferase CaiB-like acyl-CoA transferase